MEQKLTLFLHNEPALQQISPASYTSAPRSVHRNCSGRQRKHDTRAITDRISRESLVGIDHLYTQQPRRIQLPEFVYKYVHVSIISLQMIHVVIAFA